MSDPLPIVRLGFIGDLLTIQDASAPGVDTRGTYALVAVKDGTTVTAEKGWLCRYWGEFAKNPGPYDHARVDCPLHGINDGEDRDRGCGWVTVIRDTA